ncbi:MAG TPA: tRNA adenosine deaminase-associated protein [Acidothermaceae bacterium]|nr:tRNA adenosine deaminase-associated protein [Acidothermaceae bacterium]
MSHFAALAAKTDDGWHSSEVELDGLADIDEVAEVMRDASVDDGPVLLFVEQDDEWFAIVRVDGAGEPRTFISDARVVPGSPLAALVFEEVPEDIVDVDVLLDDDDDDDDDVDVEEAEEPAARPDAEPRGVSDVLADLGISASQLLAMCAEEGMLPADVITAICERLGCAEEIEVYR